ncbi:GIY-YIG nuclease superfamily protein [Brevundimonas sp. SH203]|uniref:GIY-YIG nuclease family protein n=1 Tax=Brevundimonas sp. SH203 TaxID=345167 RepID=UPI0009CB2A6E|nr:GIY-YIG nuclease family protein [Brevundimonas sp. SH203]GAW41009.1 GIY-YIG nuclease superfamily protein [Brevundimonas sp. SH203]
MPNARPFIAAYIVTNKPYGTLYTGVTSDLYRRVRQHRDGTFDGFTKTHGLSQLVWFEPFEMMTAAIRREKAIKRYLRDWKINLIERDNPRWADLSLEWDRPAVWMHGPTEE